MLFISINQHIACILDTLLVVSELWPFIVMFSLNFCVIWPWSYSLMDQAVNVTMSSMTAEGSFGFCVDMFSLGVLKLSAVTDG